MWRITINRLAAIFVAVLAPLAFVIVVSPAMSYATECGEDTEWDQDTDTCVGTGPGCGDGTQYDPDSNSCWADAPDPPPAPEAPDLSPVLDNFSVDFCLPGPFGLCVGL